MDHLNDNNHFSAEYIRKYLEGKLPADEMHALEKAALDDPFLADAIEGMSMAFENEGEFKVLSELEILKQEWAGHQTPATAKVVSIKKTTWWKPVAAAAVIIVAGLASYQLWFSSSKETELATVQKNEVPAKSKSDAAVADSLRTQPDENTSAKPEASSSRSILSKEIVSNKDNVAKKRLPATVSPSPKKTDPVIIPMEKSSPDDSRVLNAKREEIAGDSLADLGLASVVEKNKSAEPKLVDNVAGLSDKPLDIKRGTPNISNLFNGQVIDENNRPVANAIVQLQNSKNAYFTDKNGQFIIPSTDSVLDVAINSIGYNSQNFKLKNSINSNQLVLQSSQKDLGEVVVVGYGTQKKKDLPTNKASKDSPGNRRQKVIVQDAQPVSGWMEFEKYIENNKRTDSSQKNGNVVISFIINRNNELSDFKIETSLSPKQDQEALRLIKEGPAWKLLKGRRARATVIVGF